MKLWTLLVVLMTFALGCNTAHIKVKETCVWSDVDGILGCDDPRRGEDNRAYARPMQAKDVCTNAQDFLDTQREVLELIRKVDQRRPK